jgi:hypothetical protein
MDSWEALFERDRLSGKVPGASQDNPIDLCSLNTQEREWISAYGAREMANTQATSNSQLSEEVEMVRKKGSTGHRVPVIDLSGDETLEGSGAVPAVSGSTDMEARPEMEETQLSWHWECDSPGYLDGIF